MDVFERVALFSTKNMHLKAQDTGRLNSDIYMFLCNEKIICVVRVMTTNSHIDLDLSLILQCLRQKLSHSFTITLEVLLPLDSLLSTYLMLLD